MCVWGGVELQGPLEHGVLQEQLMEIASPPPFFSGESQAFVPNSVQYVLLIIEGLVSSVIIKAVCYSTKMATSKSV